MYINKPSATKIEAVDRVIFCIVLSTGLNSWNHKKLVKCLYPCPDIRHFMIVTKKTLDFRHTNQTLDNVIKIRSISKQLCMWLVELVLTNSYPLKKFCFKYMILMIKAKLPFF